MGNPVWRLFIAEQTEEWLEWLKTFIFSYREMIQRFIYLNQITFQFSIKREKFPTYLVNHG